MPPTVKVIIDNEGNVTADFSGFQGRECEKFERRLREELARYGVSVDATVSPKSDYQIAQEVLVESGKSVKRCTKIRL